MRQGKILKGIHFGSYWMKKNDVVYLMAKELNKLCHLKIVDCHIYDNQPKTWYTEEIPKNGVHPLRWLNHEKILHLTRQVKPDFIVCNAGGLTLLPKTTRVLKTQGVITLNISLSDPDVYPDNGRLYSHLFDRCYTNSLYAYKNLYKKQKNCRLLPFAASPSFHRPLSIKKKYDIVVVGHARPERLETINLLKKRYKVGLFGKGWYSKKNTEVHGINHIKAINSGKLYLSFAVTTAGYTNVKVGLFEAAACRSTIITSLFPELENYFTYGVDLLGYTDNQMLLKLVNFYLKNDTLRTWLAKNAYQKVLKEHTWQYRWQQVLTDIQKINYE